MKKTIFSKAIAILGSIAMLVGVAACGQSNDSTKTAADGNGLTKVTFMLSWAPDTNHIGVYVAKNKGYFKQAGLDVDIVAVAQAGAEQAVNNGMADFALSNLTNVGIYTLKGAKIKQVMQVQQKPSAIWCSLASNKDIKSPKDFDGKTFATFGSNESDAVIRRMIQTDGGKGTFDKVTVGTSTLVRSSPRPPPSRYPAKKPILAASTPLGKGCRPICTARSSTASPSRTMACPAMPTPSA